MSLTLEIGAFAETTEVTAVTSLISTENATVGTVIETAASSSCRSMAATI